MSSSNPANRSKRSFWFDPRFAIGLALVVASVVGVYAIVSGAQKTTTVYAASSSLVPGDTVNASDLTARQVRLGSAKKLYLTGGNLPADGVVITRTVAAGELVPASAVSDSARAGMTSVVIDVQGHVPASIDAGSVVDVWSAKQLEHAQYGPPAVIVGSATVVRILKSDGLMSDRGDTSLEVLVPKQDIAVVLEAIANADAVSVVPDSTRLGE